MGKTPLEKPLTRAGPGGETNAETVENRCTEKAT